MENIISTVTERNFAAIVDGVINEGSVRSWIGTPGSGAICIFSGTVRDNNNSRKVLKLEYEAYKPMAEEKLREITSEILKKWEIEKVSIIHRIGTVLVGEASVIVAVSAPHREDAFLACRYGIDKIKKVVPIWKKEYFEDGETWVV